MHRSILKPYNITPGCTAGVFTPSSPSHIRFREKYLHGVSELERCGFKVVEGSLTKSLSDQGYRTANGKLRAMEFMELIKDPEVDFLISTIGGSNSSSMLEYLDYDIIRSSRKLITGYSDLTSLHMAILTQSQLSTFYGPAVVPSFGEWPQVIPETLNSFIEMGNHTSSESFEMPIFDKWSRHFRDASNGDWKTTDREYSYNEGYKILNPGKSTAPIIVMNLNTVCSLAGTRYFPELNGEILLLEEMYAEFDIEERRLTQLKQMGVFEKISGLIVSKPEILVTNNAPFSYDDLILEIVGEQDYPIVSNFDCGHTHPMLTIPQMINVTLDATSDRTIVKVNESAVLEKLGL